MKPFFCMLSNRVFAMLTTPILHNKIHYIAGEIVFHITPFMKKGFIQVREGNDSTVHQSKMNLE